MNPFFKVLTFILLCTACQNTVSKGQTIQHKITPGAERIDIYGPMLHNSNIGLIVNQTSTVKSKHLVDELLSRDLNVIRIFSPEHGFRGQADAGEQLSNEVDKVSGLPIVSLYGKHKKPRSEDLAGIDMLVFDIQDVGVRFYTYISTLHYVMEAAAEANIPLVLLDRPNPLISYTDGPILEKEFKSFVGMHPVPVVYGMTIGEYGQMINGEKWLKDGMQCQLEVIAIENFSRRAQYILPIKPSPNLPNNVAIGHYPSLCFFEGTTVSIGRGTPFPFQVIGHPNVDASSFEFTPQSGAGSKYPKHEGQLCKGENLQQVKPKKNQLDLTFLQEYYKKLNGQNIAFFNDDNFFNLLAGTDQLKEDIIAHKSEDEIRASWQPGLIEFQMMREKYLIYK